MLQARVHITLKTGVLDPQGKAIEHALDGLGFSGVSGVRQGKIIDLEVAGDDPVTAESQVAEMCEKLLANTVIEDYVIKMLEK